MPMMEYKVMVDSDFKEIVDFVTSMIEKAMSGAALDDYVAELPKLMTAVDGYKNAMDAMSSAQRNECVMYALHQLSEQLLSDEPKEEPVATPETPA